MINQFLIESIDPSVAFFIQDYSEIGFAPKVKFARKDNNLYAVFEKEKTVKFYEVLEKKIRLNELERLYRSVGLALAYINYTGINHGDINTGNVLIKKYVNENEIHYSTQIINWEYAYIEEDLEQCRDVEYFLDNTQEILELLGKSWMYPNLESSIRKSYEENLDDMKTLNL